MWTEVNDIFKAKVEGRTASFVYFVFLIQFIDWLSVHSHIHFQIKLLNKLQACCLQLSRIKMKVFLQRILLKANVIFFYVHQRKGIFCAENGSTIDPLCFRKFKNAYETIILVLSRLSHTGKEGISFVCMNSLEVASQSFRE